MNSHDHPVIESPRLTLICCTTPVLEVMFEGEQSLSRYLDVNIPDNWTEFGNLTFRWAYDEITKAGANPQWLTYLPILKTENTLAGSCGFKGAPNEGKVEIGYEVAQRYRGQGLATEIASALIKHALQDEQVTHVQACTLAVENASVAVLKKNGMKLQGTTHDPEDGDIWQWEISRTQIHFASHVD